MDGVACLPCFEISLNGSEIIRIIVVQMLQLAFDRLPYVAPD